MQDNNIEDDSSEVYVYLKRPFLFNIRYNSKEIWNKMTEEDKAPYINYEEFYENFGIPVERVASVIQQVIDVPADSAWNEVIIRPTKQVQ